MLNLGIIVIIKFRCIFLLCIIQKKSQIGERINVIYYNDRVPRMNVAQDYLIVILSFVNNLISQPWSVFEFAVENIIVSRLDLNRAVNWFIRTYSTPFFWLKNKSEKWFHECLCSFFNKWIYDLTKKLKIENLIQFQLKNWKIFYVDCWQDFEFLKIMKSSEKCKSLCMSEYN